MLSDKYIAGFLDADGSIMVDWQKEGWTPQLVLGFSQKTTQDEVLHMIREALGGSIHVVTAKGKQYSTLTIASKYAQMALSRIKKYLVIKRYYAEACLDMTSRKAHGIPDLKGKLKEQRKTKSLPLPNFPSRKWLAGYLDGDGCISATGMTSRGAVTPQLHVACASYDTEGIEIIHKAFGGNIHDMRNGRCRQYRVMLPPSKAKEIFSPIVKHMVVKKDQAQIILGAAAMGHYRDGRNIKAALKLLKASPHRLNETGVDVQDLLKTVKDLPPYWTYGNKFDSCSKCGTTDRKHTGNGLCSSCYQVQWRVDHPAHAIVGLDQVIQSGEVLQENSVWRDK